MKTTKIYDNEKEVYSGKCYVNTVIFRGRIYDEFKKVGQDGIKFSLQLSNGKERVVARPSRVQSLVKITIQVAREFILMRKKA